MEEKESPRSLRCWASAPPGNSRTALKCTRIFSQNYRSINFNDIRVLNVNARVDPDLKDETGYNIDAGFRGTTVDGYTRMSVFFTSNTTTASALFLQEIPAL